MHVDVLGTIAATEGLKKLCRPDGPGQQETPWRQQDYISQVAQIVVKPCKLLSWNGTD